MLFLVKSLLSKFRMSLSISSKYLMTRVKIITNKCILTTTKKNKQAPNKKKYNSLMMINSSIHTTTIKNSNKSSIMMSCMISGTIVSKNRVTNNFTIASTINISSSNNYD